MKLKHIHIENFKGIKNRDISLLDDNDDPRRLTCFIGDNGSGKTTVLQAIALTLSLATGQTYSASDFRWHGYLPERIGTLGTPRVVLTVLFDDDEIFRAKDTYQRWLAIGKRHPSIRTSATPPAEKREIELVYDDGVLTSSAGQTGISQFQSGYLEAEIAKVVSSPSNKHSGVYWFDQYRNLGAASFDAPETWKKERDLLASWDSNVQQLRQSLMAWWLHKASVAQGPRKGFIDELEGALASFFPGIRILGAAPTDPNRSASIDEFYFLLERDGREFDIAEMSSGEQAIFCMVYEFVRLQIAKSVVLIDELELHLHPPAQQALYAALPKMGKDCQFFITTHSEFLTDAIPERHKVRLKGGRPCL